MRRLHLAVFLSAFLFSCTTNADKSKFQLPQAIPNDDNQYNRLSQSSSSLDDPANVYKIKSANSPTHSTSSTNDVGNDRGSGTGIGSDDDYIISGSNSKTGNHHNVDDNGSGNDRGDIYHNSGVHSGADPYALWDPKTGYYYAYSTVGPDPGYYFAVFRSPDLSTWQRLPGGAMRGCQDQGTAKQSGNVCWSSDARWAPEVYHNEETGWYFLFFTARLRMDLRKDYFRYSNFTDAWKLGIGVSRHPAGPYEEIKSAPIDYFPFDPEDRDINLIMDKEQKKPPSHRITSGVPRGVYAPGIDPNLYFSNDGRIFLYYARNYYRNWVWDETFRKYICESEIWGVELNTTWWHDKEAKTMPSIVNSQKNRFKGQGDELPQNITSYNGTGEIGYPPRKDGFERIIAYRLQPQSWENKLIDAYKTSDGQQVDRRETEGSTAISRVNQNGETKYVVFYSANNYQTDAYGVGYAVSNSPLGPFEKSPENPVLHYINSTGSLPSIYGPGHGSVVATRATSSGAMAKSRRAGQNSFLVNSSANLQSDMNGMRYTPANAELFYVHHAHPEEFDAGIDRMLYTTRLNIDADQLGTNQSSQQHPTLSMHLTAADQPIARGTTPIRLSVNSDSIACSEPHSHMGTFNSTQHETQRVFGSATSNVVVEVAVRSESGAAFDIGEVTNRLLLIAGRSDGEGGNGPGPTSVAPIFTETTTSGSLAVYKAPPLASGASFTLAYQRNTAYGKWITVDSTMARCP